MIQKSKTLRVRVTPEQYERIRNKASAKGFLTLSSFIVHSALESDLVFEQKFEEMHRLVKKISKGD